MRFLVTGSSGHLGEALVGALKAQGCESLGIGIRPGAFTHLVGSITDRAFVGRCLRDIRAVLHAATLHKPHLATHSRQDFVDVNIKGTPNLLEAAAAANVAAFVDTSTTSVFGDALPRSTNFSIAVSTSRTWSAPIFWRQITRNRRDLPSTSSARRPRSRAMTSSSCATRRRKRSVATCLTMRPSTRGGAGPCLPASTGSTSTTRRAELGFQPRHDFRTLIGRLKEGDDFRSPLARAIGSKSYHGRVYETAPKRSKETGAERN